VLRDLREAGADVSLELGVGVVDEARKERNGTGVDDDLCKLGGVLADLTQC